MEPPHKLWYQAVFYQVFGLHPRGKLPFGKLRGLTLLKTYCPLANPAADYVFYPVEGAAADK